MVRSKTYITGRFMEIEIFNIAPNRKKNKRRRKIKESTPAQKNLNDKKSRKHFIRLVHNNFGDKDLYVDLTYDKENIPDTKDRILKDVRNYIHRLRRWRKKNGLPALKYIYVISNCDQLGNKVRYHVHMIINDMDRDVAEQKWGKGRANTDRLQFNEYGVTGKSKYMMNQAKGERSWNCSINLKKPEAIVSDHKVTKHQMEHMANMPDDRVFIEKLINRGRKYEWTFTDCVVEYDGRQMIMDGLIPESEGFGNGISLLIRARREDGYRKADKEKIKSGLLPDKRNRKPAADNRQVRRC